LCSEEDIMTPQERQQVSELFDRLARLETAPRDREAERAIAEGLARAPHALYPLVQTVLVQDEALRRADARIRELGGEDDNAPHGGGFLDNMRDALLGRSSATSVPSVRSPSPRESDPRWNTGAAAAPVQQAQAPGQAPGYGGTFLGTAAASAAGMIGGALLLNSISSMFGHRPGASAADIPPSGSPWGGNAADSDLSNSQLARDAGIDHIGREPAQGSGLFDSDSAQGSDVADIGGDGGGDGGGGDSA
jgi:hypothetical protein